MNKFALLAIATTGSAFIATPAMAQDEDQDQEKPTVYGRIGTFFPTSETVLRIDDLDTQAPGTEIDFPNDLGFGRSSTIFEADVGFNISDNWAIEFEYFSVDRSSTATLDRRIVVEGNVFDANAQVTAGFESTLYHLRGLYRAADWDNGKGELQLSLGLHATDFRVTFEGEASVNDLQTEFVTVDAAQIAPLPTIGARVSQSLAPGISVFVQGEIFDLKVGDYDGRLVDGELGVTWDFAPNVGIGGSWRVVDYSLQVTGDELAGRIDYQLSGPAIFATFRF